MVQIDLTRRLLIGITMMRTTKTNKRLRDEIMRTKVNLRTYGCTINFVRNPSYYLFRSESQKIGHAFIYKFPWRKKDVFSVAYTLLAAQYCHGDEKFCRNAMKILSLTKHTYPKRTIYNDKEKA